MRVAVKNGWKALIDTNPISSNEMPLPFFLDNEGRKKWESVALTR